MLRDFLPKWEKHTFISLLGQIQTKKATTDYLERTNFWTTICNRKIDGKSSEKLPHILESNDYWDIGFRMSEIFHSISSADFHLMPILYILKITELCLQQGFDLEQTSGVLSRSYRSFPSFVRDYDAKEKIEQAQEILSEYNPQISQDSELDAKEHSDVLLILSDQRRNIHFRIWLFQRTESGLRNIKDRVLGRRGELPFGYHIIAPLPTDSFVKNTFWHHKKSKIKNELEKIGEKIPVGSTLADSNPELYDQIKKKKAIIEKNIERTNRDLQKIEIICNWYLYRLDYCAEILEYCKKIFTNQISPFRYSEFKSRIRFEILFTLSSFLIL
jgi:hypothetical protein